MISLFLLIFAFQNGLATEDANLRQLVNSLQLNMNEMHPQDEVDNANLHCFTLLRGGTLSPMRMSVEFPLLSESRRKIFFVN